MNLAKFGERLFGPACGLRRFACAFLTLCQLRAQGILLSDRLRVLCLKRRGKFSKMLAFSGIKLPE